MSVLCPNFQRDVDDNVVLYEYMVDVDVHDHKTFHSIFYELVDVDEDEIEIIQRLTIEKKFERQGGEFAPEFFGEY